MNSSNLNPEGKAHGEIVSEISDGLVRLLKKHYGTGPAEVKTTYGDDLVACVLRGGVLPSEQTLLEHGKEDQVAQFRHAFQDAMSDQFREVVEVATGRKVIAFMSGNQIDPDMLGELFVLEPRKN